MPRLKTCDHRLKDHRGAAHRLSHHRTAAHRDGSVAIADRAVQLFGRHVHIHGSQERILEVCLVGNGRVSGLHRRCFGCICRDHQIPSTRRHRIYFRFPVHRDTSGHDRHIRRRVRRQCGRWKPRDARGSHGRRHQPCGDRWNGWRRHTHWECRIGDRRGTGWRAYRRKRWRSWRSWKSALSRRQGCWRIRRAGPRRRGLRRRGGQWPCAGGVYPRLAT